jgi:hypothetical protein
LPWHSWGGDPSEPRPCLTRGVLRFAGPRGSAAAESGFRAGGWADFARQARRTRGDSGGVHACACSKGAAVRAKEEEKNKEEQKGEAQERDAVGSEQREATRFYERCIGWIGSPPGPPASPSVSVAWRCRAALPGTACLDRHARVHAGTRAATGVRNPTRIFVIDQAPPRGGSIRWRPHPRIAGARMGSSAQGASRSRLRPLKWSS